MGIIYYGSSPNNSYIKLYAAAINRELNCVRWKYLERASQIVVVNCTIWESQLDFKMAHDISQRLNYYYWLFYLFLV